MKCRFTYSDKKTELDINITAPNTETLQEYLHTHYNYAKVTSTTVTISFHKYESPNYIPLEWI